MGKMKIVEMNIDKPTLKERIEELRLTIHLAVESLKKLCSPKAGYKSKVTQKRATRKKRRK